MTTLSLCIFACIMATVAARYTTYPEYPQMLQYRFPRQLTVDKNMDGITPYEGVKDDGQAFDRPGLQDDVVFDKGGRAEQISPQLPPFFPIRRHRSLDSDSLEKRIHELFADFDVDHLVYGPAKYTVKGGLKGPLGRNGEYHLGGSFIQSSPFERDYGFQAGVKYRF